MKIEVAVLATAFVGGTLVMWGTDSWLWMGLGLLVELLGGLWVLRHQTRRFAREREERWDRLRGVSK